MFNVPTAENGSKHKTCVITKNLIEGFHRWPDAPEKVDFLRERHRHVFHIRCYFEVDHWDREIELIMKQWEIDEYLHHIYGMPCEFDNLSCEKIAEILMDKMGACMVEVLEDGDGGAVVRK